MVDTESLFELDSTTEEKFSKHVIAKHLQSVGSDDAGSQCCCHALAFTSNAQAGYFVKKFMEFVRAQRVAAFSHRFLFKV